MNVIFVDVDGVLNPWRMKEDGFKVLAFPNGCSAPGYYLKLHRDYGYWLNSLAIDTDSELVWGSTWQGYSNEWIGSRIGLPEMPHLDLSDGKFSESLGSLKARKAEAYANGSRFVFLDDEWNLGHSLTSKKGLHIMVDPTVGLELCHIDRAREYLLS
jgi:hypothetical protein